MWSRARATAGARARNLRVLLLMALALAGALVLVATRAAMMRRPERSDAVRSNAGGSNGGGGARAGESSMVEARPLSQVLGDASRAVARARSNDGGNGGGVCAQESAMGKVRRRWEARVGRAFPGTQFADESSRQECPPSGVRSPCYVDRGAWVGWHIRNAEAYVGGNAGEALALAEIGPCSLALNVPRGLLSDRGGVRRRVQRYYIDYTDDEAELAKHCPHPCPALSEHCPDGVYGGPNITHVADATSMSTIAQGSFHGLAAFHVLEHMPDMWGAIRAWGRTLTRNGVLLFGVPHGCSVFDRIRLPTSVAHVEAEFGYPTQGGGDTDEGVRLARLDDLRLRHADEMILGMCAASKFQSVLEGKARKTEVCSAFIVTHPGEDEWRKAARRIAEAPRLAHLHVWTEHTLRAGLEALARALEREYAAKAVGLSAGDARLLADEMVCLRVLDVHSSAESPFSMEELHASMQRVRCGDGVATQTLEVELPPLDACAEVLQRSHYESD